MIMEENLHVYYARLGLVIYECLEYIVLVLTSHHLGFFHALAMLSVSEMDVANKKLKAFI